MGFGETGVRVLPRNSGASAGGLFIYAKVVDEERRSAEQAAHAEDATRTPIQIINRAVKGILTGFAVALGSEAVQSRGSRCAS